MTNWHESPLMIVKSAGPTTLDGASLKKMLNESELREVAATKDK